MSYYIIPDIEPDDPRFVELDGPYRNKDEVIEALALIANSAIFNSKREARQYIKDFIGEEWFVNVANNIYHITVGQKDQNIADIV